MEAFNYDAARWHRLRDRVMRRDNYQCQLSKRYGKIKPAELVHHIFPVADYPEYAYCSWNLISLSRDMHNKLHNRMTDELTNMGRDLLRQTARKRGIQI
jgi:5-methylcytosine-specific restriction endonuclease McrA